MKQGYVMFKDKLYGEYKAAFEQVEIYSTANLIGIDADSELMMELLDHIMTAQESGEPVSQIVGDDVEVFCKNFFSEYKAKDRFFDSLKTIHTLSWILFIFEFLDLFSTSENGGFFGSSDIGCILVGAACGMVTNLIIYILIRPLILKSKKIKPSTYNTFFIVLLIGTIILAGVFANQYSVFIPRWISLLISAVYIISFNILKAYLNYKKYGTIKAPKQESITFKSAVMADIEKLPADLLKQFEKKNAKRQKRGKEALTEADFLSKLDKQYNYSKVSITNYFIFGGCTIVAIAATAVEGFVSILDFFIFAAILIGIEGSLCYIITKSNKVCSRIYQAMRKTMKEENLTLSQYVVKYIQTSSSIED